MADAMQVGFRTVDGVQVRCADSTGPSAPSILLTALSGPGLLSSMVMGSGGAAVPILLSGPPAEWVLAPDLVGFRGSIRKRLSARHSRRSRAIGRRRRSARITPSHTRTIGSWSR